MKHAKIMFAVLLLAAVLAYAQRAPDVNQQGEPFLRVNINPTDIPPMVNINPYNYVPKVEVARMPDIQLRVPPSLCQDPQAFRTGIGRSVAGPLMLTYLGIPQQAKVTLSASNGGQTISLGSGALTTAIYLQAGQRLDFDSSILYSGCAPM